jgi:hypothetical protein
MTINHVTWAMNANGDSYLDTSGNIATLSGAAAVAQDVATQCSTFLGECWYDSTQGIPYWQQILGKRPPASLIASLFENQALKVPDVATATMVVTGITAQRGLVGQLTITDTDGNTTTFSVSGSPPVLRILSTHAGSPITTGGTYLEV